MVKNECDVNPFPGFANVSGGEGRKVFEKIDRLVYLLLDVGNLSFWFIGKLQIEII